MRALGERARARAGGDRPELPREARHADGGRTRSRRSRSCSGRSPSRGSCSARRWHVQAPPNLARRLPAPARRGHRRLGRRLAGDDRPRQPRGAVARGRAAPRGVRARGLELAPRLAVYPEHFVDLDRWARPGRAPAVRRAADSLGLAREDRVGAGRAGRACRSSCAATRCRSTSIGERARRGRDRAALPRARPGARARLRRRRPAAARGVRRRRHATSSRGTSSTRTSVTSAAASARSRRGSSPRTCAARRTSCRTRRSSAASARRGSAARPRSASRAGSIRPSTATTTRRSSRAIKDAVPGHARARVLARSRSGRARRRSASPLDDYLARLRDLGPRLASGHGGRGARRRGARGHLPRQDHDRAVARGARDRASQSGCARTTRSCSATSTAAQLGAAPRRACASSSARTGGFTEFVPLPFVPMEAPIYLQGRARRGPTFGEALLMHAVGRLALHPWITNVQVSWVKRGPGRRREALRAGRQRPRRHADERVDLARGRLGVGAGAAARADGGADPLRRADAAAAHDALRRRRRPSRCARSFGAAPLAEPLNPPVRDAGLRRPSKLVAPCGARGLTSLVTRAPAADRIGGEPWNPGEEPREAVRWSARARSGARPRRPARVGLGHGRRADARARAGRARRGRGEPEEQLDARGLSAGR